ncbi:MAG: UvrD-helicase domain-containing protein [Bacillota bacterium]
MATTTFYPTLHQHLATDYRRNLAVTAGAGTGKTEVLTRRIIKILARERLSLDRLLVLTFTDKAAVEMKERIYGAIDRELALTGEPHFQNHKDIFFNNYISTFHAFCAALLREYPIEAGIDPYFRVLDETEKVFFLRKSINRTLRELAADKNNRDIHVLGGEFSKGVIANSIFTVIQKREDSGPWITGFLTLDLPGYLERLGTYRECMLREMAYKLYQNKELLHCLETLTQTTEIVPEDSSSLGRKRDNLLRLIPLLRKELAPAAVSTIDAAKVQQLKNEIIANLRLTGLPPKAWDGPVYHELKGAFTTLRYLMKALPLEELNLVESHESEGFTLLQALARLSRDCLLNYHDDKARENYLDFQDLQLKVLRLFTEEKHNYILNELRTRFLFIMVDEFQDTNDLQWQIIKKIAADHTGTVISPKLFIVGDEKQAIYSFRGGDVRLFSRVRRELQNANRSGGHHLQPFELVLEGAKDYTAEYRDRIDAATNPQAGEIVFADNFRSAATPINFFNMFFHDLLAKDYYEEYDARPQRLACSGNRNEGSVALLLADSGKEGFDETLSEKLSEALQAARESAAGGAAPQEDTTGLPLPETAAAGAMEISDHFKEAFLIADKIKEVFLGDDEKYRRVREEAQQGRPAVAILLNRRTMLKTYEEALRMSRIDFTVVRGRGFFQRREIVDLGNLIRFLTDPADDLSLAAYLRSPAGRLSDEGLYLLSKLPGASLWNKLWETARAETHPEKAYFPVSDRASLAGAATDLSRWLSLAGRVPLEEYLRLILDESSWYVSLCRGDRGEQALSNIEKLLESARALALEEGCDLDDFSEWLNNRIDFIEEEGEADIDISLGGAVQIMTVHQSKGLEFPMVFVPDLGAGFNLGDRETLHADQIPHAMTVDNEGISRRERPELGLNAPNPENGWEQEPILVKRIIKIRQREKLIAEKKRLLYVAATRAMDHLVLVGHTDFNSPSVIQRVRYAPLDQMNNWMDWLNRILGLSFLEKGYRGEIVYGNRAGEMMRIPYRLFTAAEALPGFESLYRTEFPLDGNS